jgi:predicted metal-dependent HD superfamily phosphohydrolase
MTALARTLHAAGQAAVGGTETWDEANHPLWIGVAASTLGDMSQQTLRDTTCAVLINVARSHYADPTRHYHNWQHVQNVMAGYRQLFGEPDAESALAIAWHDAVYVPRAGEDFNEMLSAQAFENAMHYHFGDPDPAPEPSSSVHRTVVAGIDVGAVYDHVMATRMKFHLHFENKPPRRESEKIIDSDLVSFGFKWDDFCRVQDDVLLEIKGPSVLNDADKLRANRRAQAQFLSVFTADGRPFIYRTHEARAEWEDQARNNILRFVDEWGI